MKTSFKQIVDVFEDIATRHLQVHSFFVGDVADLTSTDYTFPMLFINPTDANISQGSITFTFNMMVMDIRHKDGTTDVEVESDTIQIINDIVSYLKGNEETYGFTIVENGVACTPFTETLDQEVTGWNAAITCEVANDLSTCIPPIGTP